MPPIGVHSQTLPTLWIQFPAEAFERTRSNHSSCSSKGGSGRREGTGEETSRKKSLSGCRSRGEVGVRAQMNSLGLCHSQHAIVLLSFPNGVLSLGKKREGIVGAHRPLKAHVCFRMKSQTQLATHAFPGVCLYDKNNS